jgi:magnesium chelatase family protein
MFIKIPSVTHLGLSSIKVDVEVNIMNRGLPCFEIVGLPAKAINESKERIRAALSNSNIKFPARRIIVNLAPADIPKEGSYYDLPIAVGILSFAVNLDIPLKSLFFGELSLDGSLRHTKGTLLLSIFARDQGFKKIFVPSQSANEAAAIDNVEVYPVKNISQLISFLHGKEKIKIAEYIKNDDKVFYDFDMKEILGQNLAKRAIEISAAGNHNLFMVGGPGSGKTMIARAMPGILPKLNQEESIEVTKIYSISGNISPGSSLFSNRPFRAPHHSISSVGLVGGGIRPRPGEITLAHRGILFLDELNEFKRSTLESLRQPMEDGYITISRGMEQITYPTNYILVASANPCPCGYLNHKTKHCLCSEPEVERYKKRVSGPIMDRIDMHIQVPDVETSELKIKIKNNTNQESSENIKKRVEKARELQKNRFLKENIFTNSEMKNRHIEKYCFLSESAENFLIKASNQFSFSARSYYKIIKVARTIADLEESLTIENNHIAEALQYRLY